jgi:hypothetical protein
MQWFDVDKTGLRKLLEQRGVSFALYELIQNAWDAEGTSRVEVTLEPVPTQPLGFVTIRDDSPDGFKNLSHAWTLFAESDKKSNPMKRGRFNLGEKLVLALCNEADIVSTTGSVRFDREGRHVSKTRIAYGTQFEATMRLTREQINTASNDIRLLIPPDNIVTTFNGNVLMERPSVGKDVLSLPTLIADEADGVLRRYQRQTEITIHEPLLGETPMLYEMGIPVVETGDRWHVNVHQKVPVNLDRDNVPPSYLRAIRAAVLNVMSKKLTPEESKARWVTDAISHPDVDKSAVTTVIESRFGKDRVSQDPSDPEGTKIAVSKGYTVIPAGAFPAEAWANIRASGAVLPAGQVTPSPKPFTAGGSPLVVIPYRDWSGEMLEFAALAKLLCRETTACQNLTVEFTDDKNWGFAGCMGSDKLTVNLSSVDVRVGPLNGLAFLIHEFAHVKVKDHLSNAFHEECCRIGAKATRLALSDPAMFRR